MDDDEDIIAPERLPQKEIHHDELVISPCPLLPWDRFSNWIVCICVVTFDLEIGQTLELIYPRHVKLSDKEKLNICYMAFPDSNSGCMGDTRFHFRTRQEDIKRRVPESFTIYNHECPPALREESNLLYGFVYFRQVKDKNVRRGYFQKSVVLISRLPMLMLFQVVLDFIAPEYFANGEPGLETACHDIDQWPAPRPGETIHLPLLGNVLQIRIPSRFEKPSVMIQPTTVASLTLPVVHEMNAFRCFQQLLTHVQLLWELTLLGEPIVVMASNPTLCSETVSALVSTIFPLKFHFDFRPYFTIHNSEFKDLTNKSVPPPRLIIGVTNPFFAKALQHWPHILRLGELSEAPKQGKLKKISQLKTVDTRPGLFTNYKPFLQKDKTIIKHLSRGDQTGRPLEAQNAMLRRYFLELTQSFIIPLERHLASLMPLQRTITPHRSPPKLRPFDKEEFLRTVETSGPQLTSGLKGDWLGLYRRFLDSQNFIGWFRHRQREIECKLRAMHAESMAQANWLELVNGRQEVEVVDLVLRLKEAVHSARNRELQVSEATLKLLEGHMASVVCTLPDDLRSVLEKSL